MTAEPCKQEAIIADLQAEVRNVKEANFTFMNSINSINEELKDINKKWGERPSWGTVSIISFLSALCVGLIVHIF